MSNGSGEIDVEPVEPHQSDLPVRLDLVFSAYHYVYPFDFVLELGLRSLEAGLDGYHLPRGMGIDDEQRAAISEITRGLIEQLAEVAPPEQGREWSRDGERAYTPASEDEYANAIDLVLEVLDEEGER